MEIIRRRLRPVRFATLVAPGDFRQLARAIEFNTCLWGGIFNAIIPIFKVRPKHYSDGRFENPSAQEILLGHLETFEPDYIVSPSIEAGKACPYPFNKRVVVPPGNKVFEPGCWHGLSIVSLLGHIYNREFRTANSDRAIVAMAGRSNSETAILSAAVLGRFPRRAWGQVTQDVKELFLANELDLDASTACKHLFEQSTNLLWLGASGLRHVQRADTDERTIFYMDGTSFVDIVDFWNLRALGWPMIPCAKQWGGVGAEICTRFIARSKTQEIQIMRGRSISESDFDAFCKSVKPGRKRFIVRNWHPRIWKQHYRMTDHAGRRDVQAATDSISLEDNTQVVVANPLSPNWVRDNDQFTFYYSHWVNVFSPSSNADQLTHTSVLPYFSHSQSLHLSPDKTTSWNNSEGFIVGCSGKSDVLHFELPSHWDVFSTWFGDQKIPVTRSPAGRNVLELARATGGLSKAYYLASSDVLNIYQHLSKGNCLTYKQLVDRIKRAQSVGGDRHYRRILEFMTNSKSVRVGIEIDCTFCGRENWYSLAEMAEEFTCDRCLRKFVFPADQPSKTQWSYRALGPFSMPDFAGGAYSVLLTARFLGWSVGEDISWYPGIELKRGKGSDIEIDLAVWWRTTERLRETAPALVLSECKTFEEFQERDFKRAQELLRLFPGCTVVFSTLRPTLTEREKKGLRMIAGSELRQWRKVDRSLRVIILTSHELLQNDRAPSCWKEIAGNKYKFIEARYNWQMGHDKLQRICNVTQQLHLGMQDFYEYIDADSKKLAERLRSQQKQ